MFPLISMMAFALLTAGFLWPTEEAVGGAGLHLVVLWMALGIVCAVRRCWPGTPPSTIKFRWPDLGVMLIVAGHIVSTFVVFQVEGDRRSALNLTFEWAGLYTAWWIFRFLFSDRRAAAQAVAVVIAICVGLGTFGIWQHHAFYAEQSAWYQQLRGELDQAINSDDPSQFARMTQITLMFQERQIPLQGTARIAWENRLLNSTEPLGTFALTNTLAGILATGLVLLIGCASGMKESKKRTTWFAVLLMAVQVSLIAYCLVLTKSRSAWLGTCVGIGILFIRRNQVAAVQNAFRWLVAGTLLTAVIAGTAAFFGGLDKEVILESPRSLQFRLLYWTGTLKMLREQPLTGAGPGNFRQVYLQYKTDESSEEIRDPHNIILDAWSSSGLIGLAGLLLLIGWTSSSLTAKQLTAKQALTTGCNERKPRTRFLLWNVYGGLIGGFLIQVVWTWFNGSDEWFEEPAKWLLLMGIPFLILQGSDSIRPIDRTTGLAATAAMLMTLLAAGGFEMPAVMITLLLCWALSASQDSGGQVQVSSMSATRMRAGSLLFGAFCLAGLILVTNFGLIPVTASRYHLQLGNTLLGDAQYPSRAISQFLRAVASDPQNVTPRQRIAEVASYRLSELAASKSADSDASTTQIELNSDEKRLIDDALSACEDLIRADRRFSFSYRVRADVQWNAGQLTNNTDLQKLALEDLQAVTQQYPSSVDAWFRLAQHLQKSGSGHENAAKLAAERVLQLDKINHDWGHSDRFLTNEQMAAVKRITGDEPRN